MNLEDIERLAKISQIELNESEKVSIQSSIERSLTIVEELNKIKLDDNLVNLNSISDDDANPTSTKIHYNSLREDISLPSTNRSDLLRNASEKEGGFVIVPNVME